MEIQLEPKAENRRNGCLEDLPNLCTQSLLLFDFLIDSRFVLFYFRTEGNLKDLENIWGKQVTSRARERERERSVIFGIVFFKRRGILSFNFFFIFSSQSWHSTHIISYLCCKVLIIQLSRQILCSTFVLALKKFLPALIEYLYYNLCIYMV